MRTPTASSTVNGHSYEGADKQTENTNFALLVAKHFSEPFKDSNGTVKVSPVSPTCWAAVSSYSVSVIWYAEDEAPRNVSRKTCSCRLFPQLRAT